MTQSKKQKLDKPKKTWIINAAGHGAASYWRNPKDRSVELGHSVDAWIEYAKIAERGKLNALFVADHLALFDGYKQNEKGYNYEEPARTGFNIARVEPGSIVPVLASHTNSIGFGITFSTVSEHPYHFARRLATIDNFSKGRIGWNIVSSYLSGVGRQLLGGQPLPDHDERYVKTEEYLDVVYDLLLSSWRDDALVLDREKGVFVDPERIREINHKGKYFDVPGPAFYENTPQRFPVIVQAGSSPKGKLFAAENAELVFIGADFTKLKGEIKEIRTLAKERFGRDPNHIKFVIASNVFLGKTEEEAAQVEEEYKKYFDGESKLTALSSVIGIDLDKFELDDPVISKTESNAIRSAGSFLTAEKKKQITKRQLIETKEKYGLLGEPIIGTPQKVADELEKIVEEYDVDGFNLGFGTVWPGNIENIVDLLIPELQKRGVFWNDYPVPGGTFRENLYGIKGQTFVTEDHPAYKLRWRAGISKEEYENELKAYKAERLTNRSKKT